MISWNELLSFTHSPEDIKEDLCYRRIAYLPEELLLACVTTCLNPYMYSFDTANVLSILGRCIMTSA